MTVATLSSKGQITLPSAARRKLNLQAGDRLVIETGEREIIVRRAKAFLDMKGAVGKAVPREKEREAMRLAASRSGLKESRS